MFIVWYASSSDREGGGREVTHFTFMALSHSLDAAKNKIVRGGNNDTEKRFVTELSEEDPDIDIYEIEFVVIGRRRDCPSYRFTGYCIEEVWPIDDECELPVLK